MKTKADFQQLIADSVSAYPAIASLYQARDPRLLAGLDACAAMLAMLSAEQDVAAMEPFTKARDMTVLADAAVKGVLPFGKSMEVLILIENSSSQSIPVSAGRVIIDAQGRTYVVTVGATVPPMATAVVRAVQRTKRTITHTVTVGRPFYEVEIPAPAIGYVAAVSVSGAGGSQYTYTPDFVNVPVGSRIYHIKSDEFRRLYVQFGATDVAGYQPAAGEVITITVTDTEGEIDLAAGSQFSFEYAGSVYESGLKMSMTEVLAPGAAPMDISTMREVCSYPSTYDENAVYLGNFDFLVRRQISPLTFLSIWNEQREEEVRPAGIDNINRLFVAARKTGVADAVLQAQIAAVIMRADDSYRITTVETVDVEVPLSVAMQIPSVYDAEAVRQQARSLILREYGEASAWSKRGEAKLLHKDIYDLLTSNIQALQDRYSDMQIVVPPDSDVLPEQFRRITEASLTVTAEAFD